MRKEEELLKSSESETYCFKLIKTACLSFHKVKQVGYSFVVRAKGLEPPRRKAPDPKSGTSTNSATPAKCGANVCHLFYTYNIAAKSFKLFPERINTSEVQNSVPDKPDELPRQKQVLRRCRPS
jgi:hypothetical protein